MDLLEQVKERLSIFKNLYDAIRIIDPIVKRNIIVIDNVEKLNGNGYSLWKKENFCKNCISMRAYINNDTVIKIKYHKEKVVLMVATPIDVEEKSFIVEVLKDITQNGDLQYKLTENSDFVRGLLLAICGKEIKDDLALLNRKRTITNQDNENGTEIKGINTKNIKLSRMNKEIVELREVLNEVCCALDSGETDTDRLIISQHLDKLIVEYMKEMNDLI